MKPLTLCNLQLWIFLHHCMTSSCQKLSPEQETLLRDFITAVMDCRDNVGMSLSMVRGGQVVFAQGFGFRDLETQSYMENSTKINIGSVSKSFTATLAADVVGRQLTDWETPLVEILGPDFQLEGPFRTEQASLRDILSHKMGMPNYWGVTTAALNVSREEMCMK